MSARAVRKSAEHLVGKKRLAADAKAEAIRGKTTCAVRRIRSIIRRSFRSPRELNSNKKKAFSKSEHHHAVSVKDFETSSVWKKRTDLRDIFFEDLCDLGRGELGDSPGDDFGIRAGDVHHFVGLKFSVDRSDSFG